MKLNQSGNRNLGTWRHRMRIVSCQSGKSASFAVLRLSNDLSLPRVCSGDSSIQIERNRVSSSSKTFSSVVVVNTTGQPTLSEVLVLRLEPLTVAYSCL